MDRGLPTRDRCARDGGGRWEPRLPRRPEAPGTSVDAANRARVAAPDVDGTGAPRAALCPRPPRVPAAPPQGGHQDPFPHPDRVHARAVRRGRGRREHDRRPEADRPPRPGHRRVPHRAGARRARANGGELSLVGLSRHARRTLRALGVESCFRMPTDADAGGGRRRRRFARTATGDSCRCGNAHPSRQPDHAAWPLRGRLPVYSINTSRHPADRAIARSPTEVHVSRQFLFRLLETFFRRWVLYLVPIVVFLGLGFMSVSNTKDVYVSTGVIYVDDETLLAALTAWAAPSGQGGYRRQPSGQRADERAFQTEGWSVTMAEQADMRTALEDGSCDDRRPPWIAQRRAERVQPGPCAARRGRSPRRHPGWPRLPSRASSTSWWRPT